MEMMWEIVPDVSKNQ